VEFGGIKVPTVLIKVSFVLSGTLDGRELLVDISGDGFDKHF